MHVRTSAVSSLVPGTYPDAASRIRSRPRWHGMRGDGVGTPEATQEVVVPQEPVTVIDLSSRRDVAQDDQAACLVGGPALLDHLLGQRSGLPR